MSYDQPARYDLINNNSEGEPADPTMDSRSNGDYVEFADYDTLLDAYNELAGKLASIHDLSR